MKNIKLTDIYDDRETHRNVIKISMVFVLLLEVTIYFGVLGQSDPRTYVVAYDAAGNQVYRISGPAMTSTQQRDFEKVHGPLDRYRLETEWVDPPFPVRAWLAVAVGAPIGLALLLFYLLRLYLTFLSGHERDEGRPARESPEDGTATGRWLGGRGLSAFHWGFFTIACLLALWLIPDFLASVATGLLEVAIRFKWFSLGVAVFLAALVVWVIYLRYRMAVKMMERNIDLEKFRVEKQLMLEMQKSAPAALPASTGGGLVRDAEFEAQETRGNPDATDKR